MALLIVRTKAYFGVNSTLNYQKIAIKEINYFLFDILYRKFYKLTDVCHTNKIQIFFILGIHKHLGATKNPIPENRISLHLLNK